MKQEPSFVHLNVHSEYSLIDGIVRIKPLIAQCEALCMPAVALTDQANLFAAVKFFKAATAAGVKPIFGADLWLAHEEDDKHPYRITALCQNQTGYHHLTLLVSKAYQEGQRFDKAIIQREWLTQYNEGLIILSGGLEGDLGQALLSQQTTLMEKWAAYWKTHFPDRYYLTLTRTGRPDEHAYMRAALPFAHQQHIPVVATNDVRFLMEDDFEAHEARVCIHDGYILSDPKRPQKYSEQQYFVSQETMVERFKDIPEALHNTIEIAKRCNVTFSLNETHLPNYPVPEGKTVAEVLEEESENGLKARLTRVTSSPEASTSSPAEAGDPSVLCAPTPEGRLDPAVKPRDDSIKAPTSPEGRLTPSNHDEYNKRLALELDVINRMGFAGYFLIVADFVKWAKANDVPVGPGRGSGAGSLVAYVLGITDIDPLEHDLLFERFLNPERVSMPDFDIDFCMDGRDRVIDYVAEKYGRESVSQIITFGTMAARAVVRDVGRVLGYSYGHVDKIAKLIPFELGMTLEKALLMEELLRDQYNNEEETRVLIDLAKKLEGITRNAGKHAGGVVISPSKLTDFTAIYCESGSKQIVSQFDKDDVEAIGLVKFDFLGLRTLTIIKWALENVNAKRAKSDEPPIDIARIPIDDDKTFALLKSCQTLAVFQLESRGMRDLVKRLQPDNFDGLLALVALFRPGPLQSGMVDDFINRKHGRQTIEYLHPALETVLRPTYGVILYQEQVMQIAQILGGYTLGGADILRRAMGKKKPEEMAEQRAIFLKGAIENNVDADQANRIFDLMEKFSGYGFNKSHSAAYALIAYQTAWLKAHYPAAFMAAVLSSDMDNTDKVVMMISECRALELNIIMPDVNQSDYPFTVGENDDIIYGLGAIKGVGKAAIEEIVNTRKAEGPFKDIFDLCCRVDLQKMNRRVLEALVKAGAMDSFQVDRASIFATIDKAIQLTEKNKRDQAHKQASLFSEADVFDTSGMEYVKHAPWPEEERLNFEKEVLGLFVSGHPMNRYRKELRFFTTSDIASLKPSQGQLVVIAGLVVGLRVMTTKRGDRMAFLTLDDAAGRVEIGVFSEAFAKHRELLVKDQLLIVEGEVSVDEYSGGYRMSARRLLSMEEARELYLKHVLLSVHKNSLDNEMLSKIEGLLMPFCGGTCPVVVEYQNNDAVTRLRLGDRWRVRPEDTLLTALKGLLGESAVQLGY